MSAPFRILALTAGGYQGLFTALILEEIEARGAGLLRDRFDLVAGTSIGGVIALAVAAGVPMSRVVRAFVEEGPSLFLNGSSSKGRVSAARDALRFLSRPKYDPGPLDASLTKFPAALECSGLGAGWFLPSVNELMTVWSNLPESGKQYFFVDKVNMMTSNSMAPASALIPNDTVVHLYADVGGRTGGYAARNPSSNSMSAKTSSAEVVCARR